jgi:hypothetical protein
VRLIGARAAGEEAADEDSAKHKSGGDAGTRNSFHTIVSFHLANGGKSLPALPLGAMLRISGETGAKYNIKLYGRRRTRIV